MRHFVFMIFAVCSIALAACAPASEPAAAQEPPFDWRSDWGVEEGFAIDIDTEGYSLPTAIAFVPNPGPAPKDPLYFVTEVRGAVKVVTNDRTVYTFAENFFSLTPKEELPSGQGQVGLAGICLDPRHGYVFVTFAYQDQNNILRNNIVRFQSTPDTFSLEPSGQTEFTEIFLPYEAGLAHHIGPCQVQGETLYVSVGESWQPFKTQQIDEMYGKLIRMTLDGKPVESNPFYQDGDVTNAANYVWAYGLRNPFGLKIVEDRVFVADNGHNIDRFMEVYEGENYFWDGNDKSIATNADFVFVPSAGPVQMDFEPQSSTLFPPDYRQSFYIATSAFDRSQGKIPGIISIEYGLDAKRVLSVPKYFVKYRGDEFQMVTGLAFGPDGLYFSPLHENQEGTSPILKVTYAPDAGYPFALVQTEDPFALMQEKGCLGCHSINDDWGFGGSAGPPLDREALVARLDQRLNSEAYVDSLKEIDALDNEPQRNFAAARQEVLAADGMDRVRTWVKYRIQEPRFDNLYSQMPNLGVSEQEAVIIADFLLGDDEQNADLLSRIRQVLPRRLGYRHMLVAFGGGFISALVLWAAYKLVKAFRARRKPVAG